MRVRQIVGERGSLKWMQRLVDAHRGLADQTLRETLRLDPSVALEWRSPLREDSFAEYRDSDFLERIGLGHLRDDLGAFWPRGGPQWDGLATAACGKVILVEAKAHVEEMRSHCSASPESRAVIDRAFRLAQEHFGASRSADWTREFYQYANRLAHLYFLRSHGVDAELVFLYFLNDRDMKGPRVPKEWQDATRAAHTTLGLPEVLANVHECFVETSLLALPS